MFLSFFIAFFFNFFKHVFLILLGLFAIILNAQGQKQKDTYIITQYDINKGLSNNLIQDMNFDKNGYLWIATQGGISRFDGKKFVNYSSKNFKEIKSNRFLRVKKLEDSSLLIFNFEHQAFTVDSNSVLKVKEDWKQGKNYLSAIDGTLFYLNKGHKIDKKILDRYVNNEIQLHAIDKNNYYYIDNRKKEIVYNNITFSPFDNKNLSRFNFVFKDYLCILTIDKRVVVYKQGLLWRIFNLEKLLNLKFNIEDVYFKNLSGKNTMNIKDKIYILNESNNEFSFDPIPFQLNDFNRLAYLENPNQPNLFYFYSQTEGFFIVRKSPVSNIKVPGNDNYTKGSYNILLNEKAELSTTLYSDPKLIKAGLRKLELVFNKSIDTICFFNNDLINYVVKNQLITKKLKSGVKITSVFNNYFTNKKYYYLVNKQQIFKLVEDDSIVQVVNLQNYKFTTVCKMQDKNYWLIGTSNNGILKYNIKTHKYTEIDFFKDMHVREITYDSNINRYWIFTYGFGIYLLDENLNIDPFNSYEEGVLDFAHYMLIDQLDYYWIPTNNGLVQINKKDLKGYISKKVSKVFFNLYNIKNGLVNNEYNGGFKNSGLVLPNGHLAFSNIEGITVLNPFYIYNKNQEYPILIDKILLNNKQLANYDDIEISEKYKSLNIFVSSPNYNFKSNIVLEYKIPEIDEAWLPIVDNNLSLISLKSGKYEIVLRKRGDMNYDNYKVIQLTVKPRWFKTFLAIFLYALFAISIVFILVKRYYLRKDAKRDAEFKLLTAELKAMQSQINPHYLSNSLMSLQSMILDSDKEKAFEFIGQYGKVMRDILEKSDQSFITLELEIQTLQEYIKLEGLIRNMNFEFKCILNSDKPDINIKCIKIPTMILQPFVENAIIHGLVNKLESSKIIEITFVLENEMLKVLLKDNGLGYVNSKKNRKSFGMDNVKSRLQTYSKLLNMDASFIVEPIKNSEGILSGTLITIYMPYLLEI